MSKPKRNGRRRRRSIVLRQRARIIERNDATRVARRDTFPSAPVRLKPDAGANFKIKIRKK